MKRILTALILSFAAVTVSTATLAGNNNGATNNITHANDDNANVAYNGNSNNNVGNNANDNNDAHTNALGTC